MLLIKTNRFELETFGTYLKWLHMDFRGNRYTIYRDLDGKLAREVTPTPEPKSAQQAAYFAELDERAALMGGID